MEFKELTVMELASGYMKSEEEHKYTCIFCGETFEEGLIYTSRGRMVTAQQAASEHVYDRHDGPFYGLIGLDKQVSGLSEVQKDVLEGMYLEKDNKALGQELNISPATVRTHKFNLQKMKREAKIFLAVMEQLENSQLIAERKRLASEEKAKADTKELKGKEFTGNTLHPFFTQFNLK